MRNQTIFIPYHQNLDEACDFVFQTAKVLLKKGFIVKLILCNYAYLSSNKYSKEYFTFIYRDLLKNSKFSIIRPFINIIPHKGLRRLYKFNQELFNKYLIYLMLKTRASILWILWPDDVNLIQESRSKNSIISIYDCTDYYSSLNPILNNCIKNNETKLIKLVDYFVVCSHTLAKIRTKIRKPDIITVEGFDLESFSESKSFNKHEKKEVQRNIKIFKNIPKPIVGYVGSIAYRIDFDLLLNITNSLPKVSFVLTDSFLPMPNEDKYTKTLTKIKQLKKMSNVFFIPKTKSHKIIKEIIKYFDIGMIPYNTSYDFNKYCYPLKLFEYFYLGKPVISTRIEELKRYPKFIKIGSDAKQWERHIKKLLSKSWPDEYKLKQKKLAENNSWENKVDKILQYIF